MSLYYHYRDMYNSEPQGIKKCALLLLLNKTCFRGLYRENSNGSYNVPYGNYKNVIFYFSSVLKFAQKNYGKG